MTASCFVYLGYRRCGSTFLQKRVFPKIPGYSLLDSAKDIASFGARAPTADDLALWTALVGEAVILSHESLTSDLFSDRPEIAELVKDWNPEARIILCIRSQYSIMRSLYFLYLKDGGLRSYESFVSKLCGRKCNYLQMVTTYRDVFGPGRVKVILFEDLPDCTQEVVSDLLGFMRSNTGLVDQIESEAEHASPSDPMLRLMQFRNQITAPLAKYVSARLDERIRRVGLPGNRVLGWLARSVNPGRIVTETMRPMIAEAYGQDNVAFFQTLGKDINSYDYPCA